MNPPENDPNGYTIKEYLDWCVGQFEAYAHDYPSYEAWIESKAGACPPLTQEQADALDCIEFVDMNEDWPQPKPPPYPADDEDDTHPKYD